MTARNLLNIISEVFDDLKEVLLQTGDEQYCASSKHLSGASIGAHVRHMLELFQCLLNGYEEGTVNYDKRDRNRKIETDRLFAIQLMQKILIDIDLPNKHIFVAASFGHDKETINVESNYVRELVYNLEHSIHHMALIKVGISELTDIVVSERFGVAPSTIQYRAECAQ